MTQFRKRRVRSHVIADLSVNHVEYVALRANYSGERTVNDYGTDLLLSTYSGTGEVEPGYVYMQLKATDSIQRVEGGRFISYTVEARDLDLWLNEIYPVILIVYDAAAERAYWQYIQAYFASVRQAKGAQVSTYKTIRIPSRNSVTVRAMRKFAEFKDTIVRQQQGKIDYGF